MAVKTVVCCDSCEKVLSSLDGIAVKGNIYTVDEDDEPEYTGREAVGNNLCSSIPCDGEVDYVIESMSYYCRKCFIEKVFGSGYKLTPPDTLGVRGRFPLGEGFTNQEIMT